MQDILNANEYKTQNRGGVGQVRNERSRFLRAHVCSNESSVYDFTKKEMFLDAL
jgi:hypothetical protein